MAHLHSYIFDTRDNVLKTRTCPGSPSLPMAAMDFYRPSNTFKGRKPISLFAF